MRALQSSILKNLPINNFQRAIDKQQQEETSQEITESSYLDTTNQNEESADDFVAPSIEMSYRDSKLPSQREVYEEVNPVSNRSKQSEVSNKEHASQKHHDSMTVIQEDEHELQESTKTYGLP